MIMLLFAATLAMGVVPFAHTERVPIRALAPLWPKVNGPFFKQAIWSHITGQQIDGQWVNTVYDEHFASVGDVIVFNHGATHDVVKMPTASCGTRPGNMKITQGTGRKGTLYGVTEKDAELGAIYFGCSEIRGTWSHCYAGQNVKVTILPREVKPVIPEGCINTEATIPCSWFAVDAARCSMVRSSDTQCPTECKKTFTISCSWFQEDTARCKMVDDSAVLCRAQCGGDCGVDNLPPVGVLPATADPTVSTAPKTMKVRADTAATTQPTNAPASVTTETMKAPEPESEAPPLPVVVTGVLAAAEIKTAKSCSQLKGWMQSSPYATDNGVCATSTLKGTDGSAAKCHYNQQHAEASSICKANGGRLCSVDEIKGKVAKNSGCQMDSRMTWTSTPCTTDSSTQGALARKGNGSGSSRCLDNMDGEASVRCCTE